MLPTATVTRQRPARASQVCQVFGTIGPCVPLEKVGSKISVVLRVVPPVVSTFSSITGAMEVLPACCTNVR